MAREGKCFTFLWKLENVSYCYQKAGMEIKSPAFVVDALDKTKWKLSFYPRGQSGSYIAYFLNREADSEGADVVGIKYELAFIAEDGSVLKSYSTKTGALRKGECIGYNGFVGLSDFYIFRRSTLLPDDNLRARCRIWKGVGEMTEDVVCTALTRIGVEKRYLKWKVKNFSTLQPGGKCTYQMKSIEDDLPLISVDLSLAGGLSSEEVIGFELSLQDQTIKFCTLRLFLVDASGNKVECNKEDMWFDDPVPWKQFTFTFTKKKLLEEKSLYLPNDTVSLLWEWAFSKGIVSEEILEDKHGFICPEVKISDAQNVNKDQTTPFNCLTDNVKSLYDEHFLSDVKLRTNTNVFPAHKFILSASSSVFKAMFSNDMKEKNSDCVNIDDLSDDTIGRMLLFMYTGRVEDLTSEMASHLYIAADKYAILSLKNACSSFLKKNLSSSNACDVLLLSDFHADGDLKSAAQDYILKNAKQITNSDEWKVLMETNSRLAAETLCLLFK